jgi:hypothetical protein
MTRVMRRSLDELRRSVRSEEPVDVHEARGLLMSPSRQMRLSRMRSIADLQLPMPWKTRGVCPASARRSHRLGGAPAPAHLFRWVGGRVLLARCW